MKSIASIFLWILVVSFGYAQDPSQLPRQDRKGTIYFYWGWNWGWFTKSDIRFRGANYDFTLQKVIAKDQQSRFDPEIYLNPVNFTIPQYNFRLGYFINDHYNISFGLDHMKYVVPTDQHVKISGHINDPASNYAGSYTDDDILVRNVLYQYELTDGLNYDNIELRRFDEITALGKFKISITEGLGAGILLPRTNATILNYERHDEFHLSGYGLSAVVAVNLGYSFFFVQSELKGGFIHMPDIRTTLSKEDKASQSFFFSQLNIVLGATIDLGGKKSAQD